MTAIRFGTDGWRAAIAEEFTFAAVRRMAHGVARYINDDSGRGKRIIVSYDRRFASEQFADAAATVLAQNGIEVHLSDRAMPTQISSFSAREMQCMALVVTASHNEWLDNGIKIKEITGAPAEQDVLHAIEANIPDDVPAPSGAAAAPINITDFTAAYIDHLRTLVDISSVASGAGTIVADPIHGCGSGWLQRLLPADSQLRITEIRAERNPFFGGVNPEPIPPHTAMLQHAVVDMAAAGGIAFDGDADRVGLVTESGRFVNQLQVFGLLYWHLLEDRGLHEPAVYTVTSTQMVPRLAKAYQTESYETPVGFKFVGPKMSEVGAVIGGEESGGFGFSFHIPERDGLLAALLLLEMRAQRGVGFDQLLNDLQEQFGPSYYSRIDVRYDRAGYEEMVERTVTEFRDRIDQALAGEKIERIDPVGARGYKTYFADGSWLMLRFSGTEPSLRIYAEGPSEERVAELLGQGQRMTS